MAGSVKRTISNRNDPNKSSTGEDAAMAEGKDNRLYSTPVILLAVYIPNPILPCVVVVLYQIFARDGITLSSVGSFSAASGILHPSPPKKNEKKKGKLHRRGRSGLTTAFPSTRALLDDPFDAAAAVVVGVQLRLPSALSMRRLLSAGPAVDPGQRRHQPCPMVIDYFASLPRQQLLLVAGQLCRQPTAPVRLPSPRPFVPRNLFWCVCPAVTNTKTRTEKKNQKKKKLDYSVVHNNEAPIYTYRCKRWPPRRDPLLYKYDQVEPPFRVLNV